MVGSHFLAIVYIKLPMVWLPEQVNSYLYNSNNFIESSHKDKKSKKSRHRSKSSERSKHSKEDATSNADKKDDRKSIKDNDLTLDAKADELRKKALDSIKKKE